MEVFRLIIFASIEIEPGVFFCLRSRLGASATIAMKETVLKTLHRRSRSTDSRRGNDGKSFVASFFIVRLTFECL